MRRYLTVPAEFELEVPFSMRDLEQGDGILVTSADIPNLSTGLRGVTELACRVSRIRPDFERGTLRLGLIDRGAARYGSISASGTADYTSASAAEKAAHAFVGATLTNIVGGTDTGYGVS